MATSILTQIYGEATQILQREGDNASAEAKTQVMIGELQRDLDEFKTTVLGMLQKIMDDLEPPTTKPPVKAESYLRPPATRNGVPVPMATYDLKNDWVLGPIPTVLKDDEGNVVPAPTGAQFTSSVSDATLANVVDSADGLGYTINALKLRGTVTITRTEANGLVPPYTDTVNIVEDFTPTAADSDPSNAPHTTQPLPTS